MIIDNYTESNEDLGLYTLDRQRNDNIGLPGPCAFDIYIRLKSRGIHGKLRLFSLSPDKLKEYRYEMTFIAKRSATNIRPCVKSDIPGLSIHELKRSR